MPSLDRDEPPQPSNAGPPQNPADPKHSRETQNAPFLRGEELGVIPGSLRSGHLLTPGFAGELSLDPGSQLVAGRGMFMGLYLLEYQLQKLH